MKVSVITPNYNGVEFLDKYFKSLDQDNEYIGEVIIIDNGSNDSSLDYIEKNSFNFPIVVIKNNENLGFAPAVNQGILKSKYDYIFSLNNDTELKKGSIKSMLDLIQEDDVFSVQAKMLQARNKQLIDDAGDEYNLLGWTKKIGENQDSNKYSQVFEIFSSCAGAALYKKSIFDEIGIFDDNHIGSATSGSRYNEFKVKIAARNNVWTVYKNLPIPLKIINFIFLFLGFTIKYIFFLKKGFGSTYLEGIKEGLSTKPKVKKVNFKKSNLKNYFLLEYKLIINTFKFLKK